MSHENNNRHMDNSRHMDNRSHTMSRVIVRQHVIIGHMAQEVTTTIETREHTKSRVCIVGGHMSQACESP